MKSAEEIPNLTFKTLALKTKDLIEQVTKNPPTTTEALNKYFSSVMELVALEETNQPIDSWFRIKLFQWFHHVVLNCPEKSQQSDALALFLNERLLVDLKFCLFLIEKLDYPLQGIVAAPREECLRILNTKFDGYFSFFTQSRHANQPAEKTIILEQILEQANKKIESFKFVTR